MAAAEPLSWPGRFRRPSSCRRSLLLQSTWCTVRTSGGANHGYRPRLKFCVTQTVVQGPFGEWHGEKKGALKKFLSFEPSPAVNSPKSLSNFSENVAVLSPHTMAARSPVGYALSKSGPTSGGASMDRDDPNRIGGEPKVGGKSAEMRFRSGSQICPPGQIATPHGSGTTSIHDSHLASSSPRQLHPCDRL